MRRIVSCSILALFVASPSFAQVTGSDTIFNGPELKDMSEQTIDAGADLLEALRKAAETPAQFQVSETSLVISGMINETLTKNFELRNVGGKIGRVFSITSVGVFPGFIVENDCPEELERSGGRCMITVNYTSDVEKNLSTAIVIGVDGEDQTSIQIPVEITVTKPEEVAIPEEIAPVVIIRPDIIPVAPAGPTNEDVARRYFGSMGGMHQGAASSQPGITVVSAAPIPAAPDFSGVGYDQMTVETIATQDRYDSKIPFTDASLPVDRSKILTADRVIKAVLDTPVSNVMCGKVVAIVESDVYSATSAVPLIAAGSRIIGECGEFIGKRAGVAWNRIITTDGRSISFELPADTRDASGVGGAVGRTYSSSFDRYGLPIISTIIDASAGVIMAVFGEDEKVVVDANGNTISEKSANNEGIRIVTGEARGTAQDIIKDIQDVRRISVIPKGSRIDIEISEDIYFADDRKVVRLADMTFDLKDINVGEASRDLPSSLTLVPAAPGYQGPSIVVGGRLYKVEETPQLDKNGDVIEKTVSPEAPATLDDITGLVE
ncbi:TrbI/VirB10 family protein [Loktanella sp. DJP18]|uniref:TrbI/VirB10 family protein n=1 Tax=Loktanella sp. DJP18 TaxID=3409788 RepID=UPI003BB7D363